MLTSQDKNIVRVAVPKGEDPPYVLEGSKIYLRQEAETSLAMRDEIVALVRRVIEPEILHSRPARQPTVETVAEPSKPSPAVPVEPSCREGITL